jgi:hypothetical protein
MICALIQPPLLHRLYMRLQNFTDLSILNSTIYLWITTSKRKLERYIEPLISLKHAKIQWGLYEKQNLVSKCLLVIQTWNYLIDNTNMCTAVKIHTSKYNPFRLWAYSIFFRSSTGGLHQTSICKHRRIIKWIQILALKNCRYHNVHSRCMCRVRATTNVLISTVLRTESF